MGEVHRQVRSSMKFLFAALCVSVALVQVQVHASVVTVGPSNGMCVGINDNPTNFEEKSEIYLANCNGTFSTNRPAAESYDPTVGYIKMFMSGIAFVRDGYSVPATASGCDQTAPLDCTAENTYYVMTGPSNNNRVWSKAEPAENGGTGTYAYSSTGAFFAQSADCANELGLTTASDQCKNGFYAGTATYMMTEGSITTTTNKFDIAGEDKEACISQIDGETCGAARTFTQGQFKFSLFGYTVSDGDKIKQVVEKTAAGSTAPFQYIGFRQTLMLAAMPADGTFSALVTKVSGGAPVAISDAPEMDINVLKLCVNTTKCLQWTFPDQYNSGPIVGGEPALDSTAKTSTIKIKVSWEDEAARAINIDYLMSATELMTDGRWFVYDPDVNDPTNYPSTSGVASTTTGGATYIALSICAIAMAIFKF